MVLRTGSVSTDMAQEDPELLAMLLEDYKLSRRRDRTSRTDFASGWLAALKRFRAQLAVDRDQELVPW